MMRPVVQNAVPVLLFALVSGCKVVCSLARAAIGAGHTETVKASLYSDSFDRSFKNQKTGQRGVVQAVKATARSPNLPFGSRVRVNQSRKRAKAVWWRINDRGPLSGRIIDLSPIAFSSIARRQPACPGCEDRGASLMECAGVSSGEMALSQWHN